MDETGAALDDGGFADKICVRAGIKKIQKLRMNCQLFRKNIIFWRGGSITFMGPYHLGWPFEHFINTYPLKTLSMGQPSLLSNARIPKMPGLVVCDAKLGQWTPRQ